LKISLIGKPATPGTGIKRRDGSAMAVIRLKYTSADVDRHGNVRHYFRRPGKKKIRLPGAPGSETFMNVYKATLAGEILPQPVTQRPGAEGSFKWLCERYYVSQEWKALDVTTRRRRCSFFDRICAANGDKPYKLLERRHVIDIRDELTQTPHAANNLIKALKGLFKWATDAGHIERNVMFEVRKMKTPAGGWHTWSIAEVGQFLKHHPMGTRPALALALLMFTGQRRSDVPRLGRQHRTGNFLTFTQKKNEKNKPVRLTIPVLPILDRFIDATPSSGLSYLETAYGKPFSAAGFGMRMREWCDQAGLPHCSAHGLRKAAAALAAMNGATAHQLMSIFGWTTLQQAEVYTKAADQKRLASASMHMLLPTDVAFDDGEVAAKL
jgi:integrase